MPLMLYASDQRLFPLARLLSLEQPTSNSSFRAQESPFGVIRLLYTVQASHSRLSKMPIQVSDAHAGLTA